jgi:hypothetical protein
MSWLSDVGNVVSSVASAVGDAVEGGVDAVVDTVEDVVDAVVDGAQEGIEAGTEWVCGNTNDVVCGTVSLVGGAVAGVLEGAQDIFHDACAIVKDIGGIAADILRLDFAGVLADLGDLGIDLLDLVFDVVRLITLGSVIGGVVDYFERNALRKFVADLINGEFGADKDRHQRVRDFLGLNGGKFGFRLDAVHRRLMIDSANIPEDRRQLWELHESGEIDLYAMAGLLSFGSFEVSRARTEVKSVDADGHESWLPVNRWTIARYLESHGEEGRLRVYAMTRQAVAEKLDTTTRACKKLGVRVAWNDGAHFSWFRGYATQEITNPDLIRLSTAELQAFLLESRLRTGERTDDCTLLAIGGFGFEDVERRQPNGWTVGRNIREGDGATKCVTPGRTDSCCVTTLVERGSGVCHRDRWPYYVFQWILPHEVGHYLGLCHHGHDGLQHIMWRPGVGLDWVNAGTLSYYLDGEPHFTLEDGKNVWRFLVDQMRVCFPS